MNNYNLQLIVGTYETLSEGFNIESATYVLLYDLHWEKGKEWQAISRIL